MNRNQAFEINEEDVENVLRNHSLAVANSQGKSFESMSNEIFSSLDMTKIANAALYGDDINTQTEYAYQEIADQLRQLGVLEPLKEAPASPRPHG